MGHWKASGYIIRHIPGDHDPYHVHIYENGLIAKYAIDGGYFMWIRNGYESHTGRILKALRNVGLIS